MLKMLRATLRFGGTVLLSTALILGIQLLTHGMYLIGIPSVEDVQKVVVVYTDAPDAPQTYSDAQSLELAVSLSGFLKYALFQESHEPNPPQVTLTYFLKDGQSLSVAANQEIVWWKGKAHMLKEPGAFLKLTQGIFPPPNPSFSFFP